MATQGKKRKSKRPEGVSDDELSESNESDEEYEEGESNRSPHKRTKSTSSAPVSASKERVRERTKTTPKQTARQVSSSKARPSSSTMETAKALEAANAKREACTNQFASVFDPIFDRPPPGLEISKPKKKEACPRARNFASHVEKELMKSYGDTDPRGFPVPGQKYIDRFRTLYSNLRSNADLKTRIARSDIDANALVNITDHDLQSAELRAMAESVRAQSMKGSVKQRMELPSAKITHKGMEAIEGSSDAFVAAEKANKRAMDDQSELQKPALSKSISGPESPGDLRISQSPLARSQFTPAMDSPMKDDEDGTGQAMPSPQLNRTPSSSKANFDLNSLWGNVRPKAANSPEIGPDGLKPESGTPEGSPPPDDAAPQFDPFDFSADRTAEVDFQLDDHRPEPPSPSVKIPAARTVGAKDAPKVWSGDIITVEDGGFPASASQVAGRNIGSSPETWKQLMSSTLHVAGRIETKKATDYLVQNVFAPSRELFVIAFDPILSGPSTAYPERPVAEKTLRYHAHLIKHFGSKKKPRVGVISPPKKSASNVKDFYLVPLLATDPLPEYVELLERQNLGERRERDLFLGVFVVSRGQFATVEEARPIAEATAPAVSVVPASRPGPVASQSAADQAMALIAQLAPQTASHGLPSPAPVPPQARSAGDIANLDQSALESLLNDPSTLQSLLAVDSSLKASFMANPNLPAALTTNTATTRTVANAPGLIQEMQSNARPAQPYIHPSRAQAILNHGQPYPGPPNYGRR
ncbi:uncharacterized protein L969DRAFT_550825 [Mixia osmundae IAM 14324]|nr:uncharacterized protein L969DRAFT_550825 [Mixia osmundae IAM 14324]KEI37850.1 hypothetical protein L969DRAFT_550825 [Mixia osmundae IAM 14324]